jgi:membrane protease YdiL (CAAX protease family)
MSAATNSPEREGLLPERPVKWGIPDAAVGLVVATALIAGQPLILLIPGIHRSDALGVSVQSAFYVVMCAFVIVVSKRRGLGSIRRDFGFELRWIDLLIGLGLAVVVQVASVIVNQIAFDVLRLPVQPTGNVTLPKSFALAVFDGLVITSCLAPIVEELFFRGLVMRAIRNLVIRRAKFDGPQTTERAARISIVVSALLFAAAHLYESRNLTMLFVLGVWVFIVGLITGWVATRTGRLGPSMITHMLTNGYAAVLLLSSMK